MPQTKFLIIGSSSFSGARFVRFVQDQKIDVIAASRSDDVPSVFLPYTWENRTKVPFIKCDLNKDLDILMDLIAQEKPTHIVNFAAQGMVAQSWEAPVDWYQTNVVAQVRFHDGLRKMSGIQKYVHVSTPEVYGDTQGWRQEDFVFAPSTPYAVSRAACDLHLMSFFKAYGFPVVWTRAANVYGPGQQLYRIIPRTMISARLGKKMNLHGGGGSVRCFIEMEDVCDATYRVALQGTPGESYHISTNETISIKALVEKICHMMNVDFHDVVEVSEDRLGKDQSYLLDSTKIRHDLQWSDHVSLDQGLSETLSWIDTNLDTLKNLPHDYIHKR